MVTKPTLLQRLSWAIEYLVFRVIEQVLRLLPLSWCYRLGQLGGLILFYLVKNRREAVVRNLNIAHGDKLTPTQIYPLAKKVFSANGANLVSSVRTATMSKQQIEKCLEIEGAELLDTFLQENNGAILILSHMGNWEVAARLNEICHGSAPSAAMYRPLNNIHLDKLVKSRREASNTKLFWRKDSVSDMLRSVRDGGILGILSDQRAGKTGIVVPFFGKLTSFAPLPAIYKKRTKSGLLSLTIKTTQPGKWKVTYTIEADKETPVNTADVANVVERIMSTSTIDCFWLQDRWRLRNKPFKIEGKTPVQHGLNTSSIVKPTPFALYVENTLDLDLAIIESLEKYRADQKLVIFTSSDTTINLPNTPIIKLPSFSREREFTIELEKHFTNTFYDFILLPTGFKLSLSLPYKCQSFPYNLRDLTSSFKNLGMIDSPLH